MPSPVAHSLIGLAVGRTLQPATHRTAWGWTVFLLFSANAPDLDFLAGALVGGVNDWHRGPSHTLLAAGLYGLAAAALTSRLSWRWRQTLVAGGAVYASHVLLDACTGDFRATAGVMLLWPWSTELIAGPWMLFQGVRHGHTGDSLPHFLSELASRHNILQLQWELLVGMPWFVAAYYFAHCPFRRPTPTLCAAAPEPRLVGGEAEG